MSRKTAFLDKVSPAAGLWYAVGDMVSEPILLSLEEASKRLPKGFSPRTLKRLKQAGKISRGISCPAGVWVADPEILKKELLRW